MKKEMPGQRFPCLSTWYKHINVGDVGVRYGETPYHPKKKPKRPKPHSAMTVPGRLTLNDRSAGANKRSRFGHYEMDTIVLSTNGRGSLLVLIDRKSRRYVIDLLAHVTQDDVVAALKRMITRKALGKALSITTDNGCEFLDPDKIKSVVGCNVYYSRAYASWGKVSIENCNRLVRRWYPNGTDLAKCKKISPFHRAADRTLNYYHASQKLGHNTSDYIQARRGHQERSLRNSRQQLIPPRTPIKSRAARGLTPIFTQFLCSMLSRHHLRLQ